MYLAILFKYASIPNFYNKWQFWFTKNCSLPNKILASFDVLLSFQIFDFVFLITYLELQN